MICGGSFLSSEVNAAHVAFEQCICPNFKFSNCKGTFFNKHGSGRSIIFASILPRLIFATFTTSSCRRWRCGLLLHFNNTSQEEISKERGVQVSTLGGHLAEAFTADFPVNFQRMGIGPEMIKETEEAIRRAPINSGESDRVCAGVFPAWEVRFHWSMVFSK